MADQTATAVQGTVLRVVKLDLCGNPVTGASSAQVVTSGYISVSPEPQYEDGDVFRTKKANGQLCINHVGPNIYANSNLGVVMCVMDPDAQVMMTGARILTTGAPVTGTGAAYGYANPEAHFSLETWSPITGRGRCDPITGAQRYIYWAWPHVWNGKVNGWTIENGAVQWDMAFMTEYPSPLWGDGPGSVTWLPGAIDTSTYFDDYVWNITTTPPPIEPTIPGAFPVS